MQLYLAISIQVVEFHSGFDVTYLTKRSYLMNVLLFTPETPASHNF
jgi:hypothetical protein